mmetsp:Transcript_2914/g.11809  ORF Transcript_2914/g.11809 Transcript_2914/m.11809 type:complete len:235 (-) Transcript_2914:1917-2621(-)
MRQLPQTLLHELVVQEDFPRLHGPNKRRVDGVSAIRLHNLLRRCALESGLEDAEADLPGAEGLVHGHFVIYRDRVRAPRLAQNPGLRPAAEAVQDAGDDVVVKGKRFANLGDAEGLLRVLIKVLQHERLERAHAHRVHARLPLLGGLLLGVVALDLHLPQAVNPLERPVRVLLRVPRLEVLQMLGQVRRDGRLGHLLARPEARREHLHLESVPGSRLVRGAAACLDGGRALDVV